MPLFDACKMQLEKFVDHIIATHPTYIPRIYFPGFDENSDRFNIYYKLRQTRFC